MEVAKRVARRGDLIIEKSGGGEQQPVGRAVLLDSDELVMPTNFASRLRPIRQADPRFVCYLLAALYSDGRTRAAIKQTTGIQNLDLDSLLSMHVTSPPLPTQRAIADYLDAETARIDALIEKKRRMMDLIERRFLAFAEKVITTGVKTWVPLKFITEAGRPIMYGIVLPGPDVPAGVPIVKGGDVAAQRLDLDRLCRTTYDIERPYARARLRERDLVFAIRGGIGDVELVPPELNGANITQDVARIAAAPGVDPHWLLMCMKTPSIRRQVERRVTGATVKGLNIMDLKRIRVPESDEGRQRSDLALLMPARETRELLRARLASQIRLLEEHRKALIGESVAGTLPLGPAA